MGIHITENLEPTQNDVSPLEASFDRPSRGTILGALFNRIQPLQNTWRRFFLRQLGIKVGSECRIAKDVAVTLGFANGRRGHITLSAKTQLGQGAILDAWGGTIVLDENVFIGPYSLIYGHGGVTIGKDTLIAAHCQILSSNHTIPDRDRHIRREPDIPLPTAIGEDVWLGAGVTVLGGVTIGKGCVVGAGAVVTKDLPPYSIAVGVPANVLRTRSHEVTE